MSGHTINSRHVLSAIVAVAMTFAIHGGWLTGMDRDAAAAIAEARA